MRDKELIKKIKELRQIKPNQTWVVFTKQNILGEEEIPARKAEMVAKPTAFIEIFGILTGKRLAYATITALLILVGTFGFAQNTVPGDVLFPLKKVTERTQGVFVSGSQKPRFDLELVNKRLEDLARIVQSQQEKNLAPAIEELEATAVRATKSLEGAKENKEVLNQIAQEMQKYEENKKIAETVLGTLGKLSIDTEKTQELDNALADIIQKQIESLENSILTEEQETLLNEVKEDYENKNYSEALRKVLQISNN